MITKKRLSWWDNVGERATRTSKWGPVAVSVFRNSPGSSACFWFSWGDLHVLQIVAHYGNLAPVAQDEVWLELHVTVSPCVSARDWLQASAPVPAVAEPSLQPLYVRSHRASATQHRYFGIDSCGGIHPFLLLSRLSLHVSCIAWELQVGVHLLFIYISSWLCAFAAKVFCFLLYCPTTLINCQYLYKCTFAYGSFHISRLQIPKCLDCFNFKVSFYNMFCEVIF